MTHFDLQHLLCLTRGELPQETAEVAFAHLAECPACHVRATALRRLRDDFDGAWDSFLRESAALRPSHGGAPVFQVVGFLATAVKAAVAALHSSMEGQGWTCEPLRSSPGFANPQSIGVHASLVRARAACERKDWDYTREELARLAGLDPDAACSTLFEIRRQGLLVGKLAIDARRRVLSILLIPDPTLVPERGRAQATLRQPDGTTRTARFQEISAADYLAADFEDVIDGPIEVIVSIDEANRS